MKMPWSFWLILYLIMLACATSAISLLFLEHALFVTGIDCHARAIHDVICRVTP